MSNNTNEQFKEALKNYQNGIEKRFNEIEWQGIYFDELEIELDSENLPSDKFYNEFYKELFKRYSNFESLPKSWLQGKKNTASDILKETSINQSILSYGCGLGFIEKELSELDPTLEIYAYDFSNNASKWIKNKFPKIIYQNNISINDKFDLIYLCQLLYAFNSSDCIELIKNLSKHLNPNGKILLINTSVLPIERGEVGLTLPILKSIKNILRPLFRFFSPIKNNHKEQFWGWQRDNKKYIDLSLESGMNIDKNYFTSEQLFIVLSNPTSV